MLVVDGEVTSLDRASESFETVLPRQLPLSADEFRTMAAMYDVRELVTAVKPFFLRFLLDRGAEVAIFLDSDVEVFAPLDGLGHFAREQAIVLIPHMLRPIPRDGRKPTQADIVASGVYNLGFMAVSRDASSFLEWWGASLRPEHRVGPEEPCFVDQRLLDFLPGYLSPGIVREPAYAVAYWNLHERRVSWNGAHYEVGGAPLGFFHFSGFDPASPHLLSTHQGSPPRILLSQETDLARLSREYAERLLAAGYLDGIGIPYGFAKTAHGLAFDRRMRRVYREGIAAAASTGAGAPPNPLDPREVEDFMVWLNSPPDGTVGPTRYLRRVYDERPDLRVAFPDLAGADLPRYTDWVRMDGRADPPIPAIFRTGLPPYASTSASRAEPGPEQADAGVNIAGFVRAELGTGEGARLTVAAVKAAGIPYSVMAYGGTSSRQLHPFDDFGTRGLTYSVNLIHMNADRLPAFAETYWRDLLKGRYTVGIWAWEVESFPAAMAAAEHYIDEIWAVSEFAAAAIAKKVSKPVFTFPHPVIPPTPPPISRAELGLPDGFVFLFCFDFFSVMERKNPRGLIDAFSRAFSPNEGPLLVIKTINGTDAIDQLEKLRITAADRPDIRIVDGYLSQSRTHALIDACDAYVSLHRGEGFGLTMAEAMALGKPVIATGYSGNLDFMNEHNSYLVPFELTMIPRGCGQYPTGARWAAPDLDEAARLMRHVYEHPDDAQRVGQRARGDILRLHSPETRSSFIRSRLTAIRAARVPGTARHTPALASSQASLPSRAMSAAVALAATAPPLGSRHAPVRLLQRAALRLLRPLLNHQRAVVEKLIDALAEVDRQREERDADVGRLREEAVASLDRGRQLEQHLAGLAGELSDRVTSVTDDMRAELGSLARALDDVAKRGGGPPERAAREVGG